MSKTKRGAELEKVHLDLGAVSASASSLLSFVDHDTSAHAMPTCLTDMLNIWLRAT